MIKGNSKQNNLTESEKMFIISVMTEIITERFELYTALSLKKAQSIISKLSSTM